MSDAKNSSLSISPAVKSTVSTSQIKKKSKKGKESSSSKSTTVAPPSAEVVLHGCGTFPAKRREEILLLASHRVKVSFVCLRLFERSFCESFSSNSIFSRMFLYVLMAVSRCGDHIAGTIFYKDKRRWKDDTKIEVVRWIGNRSEKEWQENSYPVR